MISLFQTEIFSRAFFYSYNIRIYTIQIETNKWVHSPEYLLGNDPLNIFFFQVT